MTNGIPMIVIEKPRVKNSEARDTDAQLSAQLLADVVMLTAAEDRAERYDMTVTRAAAYIIRTIRRK